MLTYGRFKTSDRSQSWICGWCTFSGVDLAALVERVYRTQCTLIILEYWIQMFARYHIL